MFSAAKSLSVSQRKKSRDEQQIHGEYFIEKQYEEDGEIYYRILTNEASEVLTPAAPALEDGYMCVIKEI